MLDAPESRRRPFPVGSDLNQQRDAIRADLLARLESVPMTLLPAGKKRGQKYPVGDARQSRRQPGGVARWETVGPGHDHATGGDIFDLIAAHHGSTPRRTLLRCWKSPGNRRTGLPSAICRSARSRKLPVDELGSATVAGLPGCRRQPDRCAHRYDPRRAEGVRPGMPARRKMAPRSHVRLVQPAEHRCCRTGDSVEGEVRAWIEAGPQRDHGHAFVPTRRSIRPTGRRSLAVVLICRTKTNLLGLRRERGQGCVAGRCDQLVKT